MRHLGLVNGNMFYKVKSYIYYLLVSKSRWIVLLTIGRDSMPSFSFAIIEFPNCSFFCAFRKWMKNCEIGFYLYKNCVFSSHTAVSFALALTIVEIALHLCNALQLNSQRNLLNFACSCSSCLSVCVCCICCCCCRFRCVVVCVTFICCKSN